MNFFRCVEGVAAAEPAAAAEGDVAEDGDAAILIAVTAARGVFAVAAFCCAMSAGVCVVACTCRWSWRLSPRVAALCVSSCECSRVGFCRSWANKRDEMSRGAQRRQVAADSALLCSALLLGWSACLSSRSRPECSGAAQREQQGGSGTHTTPMHSDDQ